MPAEVLVGAIIVKSQADGTAPLAARVRRIAAALQERLPCAILIVTASRKLSLNDVDGESLTS